MLTYYEIVKHIAELDRLGIPYDSAGLWACVRRFTRTFANYGKNKREMMGRVNEMAERCGF